MGLKNIKVAETGHTYFDDDLRKDGFVGDVEGVANAATLTFFRPGSSWKEIKKSLKIIMKDIELREEMENKKEKE